MRRAVDSWYNALSKIGLGKAKSNSFAQSCEPSHEELSNLYEGDWLARKCIRVYPETAFQRGFELMEKDEALVKRYRELNYLLHDEGEFQLAEVYSRLHGGALLVLGTGGDPGRPLQPGARVEWIEAISCVNIQPTQKSDVGTDTSDPATFGRPLRFRIMDPHRMGGSVIDASRCIVFTGQSRAPRRTHPTYSEAHSIWDPWGISVLSPLYKSLADYGIAWQAVSELLQISSVGVLKMSGLMKAIAQNDAGAIETRADLMETLLSVNRLLMLDADHPEEYHREPVSFADIPDLLVQMSLRVSASVDIPVTVLGLTQAGGMNASGESDQVQWHDLVGAYRTVRLQPKLERLLGAVDGRAPGDGVAIEWAPLSKESALQREELRRVRLQNDESLWRMGVISELEIRQHRAKTDTLGIEVTNPDELPERPEADEPDDPDAPDDDGPKGANDPSANTQPRQDIGQRETSTNGPDDAPKQ